jgi:hypothetical protein
MLRRSRLLVGAGLALAVALVLFVAPYASTQPDGLERVARDQGFAARGEGTPAWRYAPLPEYSLPGVESRWSKALAGVVGVAAAFGVAYGVGRLLARRNASASRTEGTGAKP